MKKMEYLPIPAAFKLKRVSKSQLAKESPWNKAAGPKCWELNSDHLSSSHQDIRYEPCEPWPVSKPLLDGDIGMISTGRLSLTHGDGWVSSKA